MQRRCQRWDFVALAGFALLLSGPPAHPNQSAKADDSAKASSSSQSPAASDYVGSEVCMTCHDDIYKGWEKTPHWKTTLDTKGGPSHQGCESCHGPGAAHVAGGGDITKIFRFKDASTKEINVRCMNCHAGGDQHMNAL